MANLKGQKANAAAPMRVDGTSVDVVDKYVFVTGAFPIAADTIDFRLSAGSQVARMTFQMDDLDSNGSPTLVFGVGYRAVNTASALTPSTTYFAAAGQTTGQAGGRLECAFKPIKFEEDVFVQITIGTAAATGVNNGELWMIATINQIGAT